jgi:ribosomal-protein-alanine N-acetyltransferase
MRIRPMTPADLPVVAALDRLCLPPGWSPEVFAAELASAAGCYLVAEAEDPDQASPLGYVGGTMILDEAHLSTLGVEPARRGAGVGTALVGAFLREGVRRGCRRFTLEVRESNAAALALYRRFGFQPVSRRRRYYPDNEDALVLWIEEAPGHGWPF